MDVDGPTLLLTAVAAFVLLCVAIVLFLGAVWLGLRVIAPRLRRALDRAEIEDDVEP